MRERIRRLNSEGLIAFQHHILLLAEGSKNETPSHLLTDPRYSESIDIDVEIEPLEFKTRFDLGIYLSRKLSDIPTQSMLGDIGFWSWLALFWFDQLCPPQTDGHRKPSKEYNYVLSANYNHRPRHAIYTTWMLVTLYGEHALFLLSKALHERGELIEQLAARQYLISCQGVIEAAKELYYDPQRKTFKRGATSQKRNGNIRRFIAYLQQLDLTYDLGTLKADTLLKMLPNEYSAFRTLSEV